MMGRNRVGNRSIPAIRAAANALADMNWPQTETRTHTDRLAFAGQQLLQLLAQLPTEWLRLCWTAQHELLELPVQPQLSEPLDGPMAERAVGLAVALWLAGAPEQADTLLLKLDARMPGLGLVPDPWGLWPSPEIPGPVPVLMESYLAWRHGEATALEATVLPMWRQQVGEALAADPGDHWRRLLEPQALALLALLLAAPGAADRLRAKLEPLLVQAVGEAVVAQHPQEALLFWSGISQRCPNWEYARLKTADLSLLSGQWQRSATALAEATADQQGNPWLHDIKARLAMAQGRQEDALGCWEAAIAAAAGDAELVELLRQRRRDAEWEVELIGDPQLAGPSGEADLDRFSARLQEVAQRFGVPLPQGPADAASPAETDPETFAAFLDQASGRLALAG